VTETTDADGFPLPRSGRVNSYIRKAVASERDRILAWLADYADPDLRGMTQSEHIALKEMLADLKEWMAR
jgi:hypothetical protein